MTVFATTQWTRVLEARGASPEAKQALSDLCAAYYAPVFAFVRRNATDEEKARDLTQEFFRRLLSGKGVDSVDPQRGRFRSFLLGAVKHFLADMRDHAHRNKRGSGEAPIALDTQLPDSRSASPDREFDRKWALTVLDRALAALQKEHDSADQFSVLKPWLTGDAEHLSQADAAAQLNMNIGAVKVAIHRLRRRFRDLVKSEIARTLSDPAHVRDELAALREAMRG